MENSRFKFRIWEIKEKRYNKYPPYGYQGGTFNMFSTDESLIEQCTGLKDRNGRLIYEGDIVNIFCCRHPYGYLGRTKGNVYWSNQDAEFRIKVSLEEEYNLYGIEIEVIGNIHENADLLEKKND